jgi:hypothetical protein
MGIFITSIVDGNMRPLSSRQVDSKQACILVPGLMPLNTSSRDDLSS